MLCRMQGSFDPACVPGGLGRPVPSECPRHLQQSLKGSQGSCLDGREVSQPFLHLPGTNHSSKPVSTYTRWAAQGRVECGLLGVSCTSLSPPVLGSKVYSRLAVLLQVCSTAETLNLSLETDLEGTWLREKRLETLTGKVLLASGGAETMYDETPSASPQNCGCCTQPGSLGRAHPVSPFPALPFSVSFPRPPP